MKNADGTVAFKVGAELTTDQVTNIGKYYSTATLGTEAVEGTDFKITEPNLYDKDGNAIAANGLESYFETDDDGKVTYKGGLYDSNGNAVGTKGNTLQEDDKLSKFISKSETGKGALSLNLHVGADATSNNQIGLEIEARRCRRYKFSERYRHHQGCNPEGIHPAFRTWCSSEQT